MEPEHTERTIFLLKALSFVNQCDNILLKLFPTAVSPDLALWEWEVLRRLMTDLTAERSPLFRSGTDNVL